MNISVQRWDRANRTNNKDNWAIVLDGEHILFVGQYVACEDWLDRHEALRHYHTADRPSSLRIRCAKIAQRSLSAVRTACDWCAAFLVREDGTTKVTEFLLMAAVLSTLYIGGMISMWTVWKANVLRQFPPLKTAITAPIAGRPDHGWRRGNPDDSIDIVCDSQR